MTINNSKNLQQWLSITDRQLLSIQLTNMISNCSRSSPSSIPNMEPKQKRRWFLLWCQIVLSAVLKSVGDALKLSISVLYDLWPRNEESERTTVFSFSKLLTGLIVVWARVTWTHRCDVSLLCLSRLLHFFFCRGYQINLREVVWLSDFVCSNTCKTK